MDRSMTNSNKILLEQGWLDHMMRDDAEWGKCRSTHRIYLQKDLALTIWQHGPAPLEIASAVISDFHLSAEDGLVVTLSDVLIGCKPVRLAPYLFAWVPAFSDVRYAPAEHADPRSRRRLTVPLCLKSISNPERDPLAGAYYLSKRPNFLSQIRSVA